MTILAILTTLLLIASVTVNIFLIKAIKVQLYKTEVHEKWIVELQKTTHTVYNTMMEIDSRQLFNKDDDVGAVFTQLRDLIAFLDEKVK